MLGSRFTSAVLASALVCAVPAIAEETPRDLGLVERAVARLAQIDVTIEGPEDAIAALRPEDFEVRVLLRPVTSFTVDSLCGAAPADRSEPGPDAPSRAPAARPPNPATFVFYFDQPYLTPEGRQRSIDTARELIPRLVSEGASGTILSNAAELSTIAPMTSDPEELLSALTRMEEDRLEWDPWAALEENRLAEVARAANEDLDRAVGLARGFQLDERWRVERDLRRLGMVIGHLTNVDPPKVFLYFADAMRSNAGEHYLSFFGRSVLDEYPSLGVGARNDALTALLPFDRVVDEASAHGVRFYTVEARGMAAPATFIASRGGAASLRNAATPTLNLQRIRDAQGTLKDMALETGGRAFLNGIDPGRIGDRIQRDLSCVYLISFDPEGYPEDRPLPVSVKVRNPKIRVHARGRLVVAGESARLTSRLLATFAAPELQTSDLPLRIGVLPGGWSGGAFTARVQVAAPATPIVGATWDLGASLVSRSRVREDVSGRIRVGQPGVPVVLEKEMRFGGGPFELIGVAHEGLTDQVASARIEGSFPDVTERVAAIGPIAVLQRASGAFQRNGETLTSALVAAGPDEPLRPELPTALVGLVCRDRRGERALRVERLLIGETVTPLGVTDAEFGDEPCARFLDIVPEGTFGPGRYTFVVRLLGADGELSRAERRFLVGERPVPP